MSERMSDERLAEVSSFRWRLWNKYNWKTLYVEMVDALKAEREMVEELYAENVVLKAEAKLDKQEIFAACNNADTFADRIAELEALNASYNCDRERHHRLIDKLQAKLDAAKDIARSAYVGEGGSISAFEYAWKVALGEAE